MKKISILALCALLSMLHTIKASAQANELAQLALNIEKLAQFKQILADLKKGYEILSGGYATIKNISEGNFELHKLFLDGLMKVSPAVRKYKRVGDIIYYQVQLVKEYKTASRQFIKGGWFKTEEIEYISNVYKNLFTLSLKNLDDLFTVVTENKLRMNDEERLAAIDRVYDDVQDKLLFLRSFNSSTSVLALQRAKESAETKRIQEFYKP